ncbi:MAG TPA: FAD:protein FMN transferase, partial [Planctomycetota bacterium]|nr:FAD:protein FMN transferase [Planctomycetota bacterium]
MAIACASGRIPSSPAADEAVLRVGHVAMGCLFDVEARGVRTDVVDRIVATIDETDRALSTWDATSDLSRLNREADRGPVRVGGVLADALRRAIELSSATAGAFDVTVGPLVEAYGFRGTGGRRVPSDEDLARLRVLVGVGGLHVRGDEVSFDRPGMRVDLDGIGKGIAVDRVLDLLRREGVADAYVSAGGSTIGSIGPPAGFAPRVVAIESPDGIAAGDVELRDAALSTSGNWRNGFEAGGRWVGHVFDPRAGRPAETDVVSATVIAERADASDAFAKAFVIAGSSGAASLAARLGVEVVLLVRDTDGSIRVLRVGAHASPPTGAQAGTISSFAESQRIGR